MIRKKLIKRMSCIGIAISMIVGNVSPYVVTNQLVERVYADEVTIGNSTFKYSFNEDGVSCTITGYSGSETEVVVPSELNGYSVTSIGKYAFSNCSSLESIDLPEGVTSIEDDAFLFCSSLSSIDLPEGVTSIGGSAFFGCSSLSAIDLPEGVTSIGNQVFSYCSSLESIKVNENNQYYDSRENCNAIIRKENNELIEGCKNTKIPEGVTSIGEYAFGGCNSLSSIDLPEGVTSIGKEAFLDCSSLRSIDLSKGVTSIGEYAFSKCSSLESIELSNEITNIGKDSFSHCSSLRSIELPDGITSIGYGAFSYCSSLESIDLPDGVTSIGKYAFSNCSSLRSIDLPESVTSIVKHAFSYCSSLKSIDLPEGITSIGESAFYGCSSLRSIDLPEGVTSIGKYAFYQCSSLESIDLPDKIASIGKYAFYGCSSLSSIAISKGVASIEERVFSGCTDSLIIYTSKDSYAEKYAIEHGINVEYIESQPVVKKSLSLNKTKYSLVVGGKFTLKPTYKDVTNNKAIKTKYTWKSSNKNIVKVSKSGVITGVKAGTATITVTTSDKKSKTCKVTVKKAPKSITLNKTKLSLKKGKTYKITYKLTKNTYADVVFTTSNKKVASINKDGKIKALKKGKATIKAKTSNGKVAICTVTVK